MIDVVIGSFTNHTYEDIKYWTNSLNRVIKDEKKVLVVSGIDSRLIDRLVKDYYHVFNNDIFGTTNRNSIVVQRFYDIYKMLEALNEKEAIRHVVTTDVRDVVFQSNPFDWIRENIGDADFIASGEGLHYQNEPWSKNNMVHSYDSLMFSKMAEREIRCAGVMAGTYKGVEKVTKDIWLECKDKPGVIYGGGGPDQAAYNVLLKQYEENKELKIKYVGNDEGFAVQLGTTMPAIKSGSGDIGLSYKRAFFPGLYEDDLRPKMLAEDPVMQDGLILAKNKKPFAIVHQYDRVDKWRDEIRTKYGKIRN